jgi:hypothetical protein
MSFSKIVDVLKHEGVAATAPLLGVFSDPSVSYIRIGETDDL